MKAYVMEILRKNTGTFVFMGIAVALYQLQAYFPEQLYKIFAYPSAWMASFFFGSSFVLGQDNMLFIPLSSNVINITSGCTGYGFFCILTAIYLHKIFKVFPRGKSFRLALLGLPFCYFVTVITNGFRIICAYRIHSICKVILPADYQSMVHHAVGIVVFLSTILLLSFLFERKYGNERIL
ncbi:MAG: hypothetical protein A2Y03_06740 [Omnitrophica WOR_2 bacterium GWF2_38_59]|nr:MAG: hypothetical protein A2Y03_06740 [Omnitrophica WOR_2 bacterium GWF2_38_59]OGX49414.1 MAG: hypothetical protein A2243_09380 [Omnitrophica WOR_2 bacterium RIFOXYA2_FULL_38_17]OGX54905.1 MAG: hypothetical protein A2267_01400 [Omnitrophica WOR_2 bacterium RIFOXYA12_FULL_38_10]OGX57031.1 MAG: hypothetical protein A2447_02655 [Omnitrophica WOR_2 bacterium RIFOXYC2_FULL_38_12]OGX59896.1 MAG: hypothetical protein A2306_06300 [Omnitrophica WOR_2 bacterium RIFOXYB2_FULL_38_16]HBG62427.1 hypothet